MKVKEFLVFLTGLFFLSNVTAQTSNKANKKGYWSKGCLKVDSAFKKTYLDDFLVPYNQFEDLHHCRIRVKTKKLNTTMAARPGFLSLFLGKRNRLYIIHVNDDPDFDGVLLSDVPQEARIGLFAHEMMHIRDYESRKMTGVINRGLQYLTKKGKKQVEYYTDSLTIAAGFGVNLFQWAAYVLHDSDASAEYKAFKEEIYMSPITILSKMDLVKP